MVKVHQRSTCRLCDSTNVEMVLKLEPIPLSENYCNDSETGKSAKRYPVDLYMCSDCGHVQQLDVIDSKSLWDNYTYYSGEAKGMPEHFQQVTEDIIKDFSPEIGSLVIDIGSNDGSLLVPFKRRGYKVLGIDPAKEIASQATQQGIETIPELMSLDLAKKIVKERGPAQVVCMFNAFAHADNMNEIAESIHHMLGEDGIFVFEAQYLMDIIDKVLIATIFHEHISHHSVKALTLFFNKHGLELINVQRVPIQHGSIIGTVQLKVGNREPDKSVKQLLHLEAERKLSEVEKLKEFGNTVQKLREKTQSLVKEWKYENAGVAGYGAARSGPTLISQLGLTGVIDYILDDHAQKVGKYSSGDGLEILPTSELCKRMPDYTVILAWVHSQKIIQQNQDYLEKGGKFVVLCPEITIIGND
ncbi:MAG: methyltransferase domain-containing protein [Opitutales bacterium]